MRMKVMMVALIGVCAAMPSGTLRADEGRQRGGPATPANDPVRTLVGRLELDRYKTTIKGLTQFGDRRQGTERNRKALDWIEAQLKSYGCPTERIQYVFEPPATPAAGRGGAGGGQAAGGRS